MNNSAKKDIRYLLEQMDSIRHRIGLPTEQVLTSQFGIEIGAAELQQVADNLDVTAKLHFASHRRYFGWFVVWVKSLLVNSFFLPMLRISLSRQWLLNQHLYKMSALTVELVGKIRTLENRIKTLEDEQKKNV